MSTGSSANKHLGFFLFSMLSIVFFIQFYFFPGLSEEFYGKKIYPVIREFFDFLIAPLNQSIALVIIGVFLYFITYYLLKGGAGAVFRLIIITIALFYWLWGFNYYRRPLSEKMELHFSEISDSARLELTMNTLQNCIDYSMRLNDDESASYDTLLLKNALMLAEKYPFIIASRHNAVEVKPATLLLRLGILGLYFPYSGQAQFESELGAIDRPFTMAHEWCHASGIAPEYEADFLAYLICTESDNAALQYSGNMQLLYELLFYYKLSDPDRFQSMIETFTPRMNEDIEKRRLQYIEYSGPISEMSEEMIDRYLKMNNQGGIGDYHRLSEYVLAWSEN